MTTTDDSLSQPQHEGHRGEETDVTAAERIPPGRNPRHFGIDPSEPWPDDVPMDQDDTHWRYEHDPKGARRAELRVAACWTVTLLASLGLAVVYIIDANNQLAGLCWALAFAGLGIGLILWARDLMPGHDVIASRGHHDVSAVADRVAAAESLSRGVDAMARRSFLTKLLLPVGAVFGLATIFPLASLGPRAKADLTKTSWGKGTRAVTQDGTPIRPTDLPVDGILTVFPEGHMDDALSPTLLINVGTDNFRMTKANQGWNIPVSGGGNIVAFSKICTHAGCPASLYNVQSKQLVCPCHQSTFDVLLDCKPVFGPAPRSLPQLPLTVNSDGYIVSQSDYTQPVGPGFWSRG
ncbi:MAG TPA: Rieske 2Fe-2S domain-containing protein [Acidimicrobiales bacterium]|nr:Rieske 2Fe-2S domain-containing protein [Acidimicrobiales bacterium]